jgi:cytoskeleton protein RodZ
MSSDALVGNGAPSDDGDLPLRHPADLAAQDSHVGITLANARDARGMSIDQLAAQLKISPKKLGLLERGEFEQIEGGSTYVRALCRSVCKALRMDEAAILDRLPSTVRSNLPERDTSLRTPFKEHTMRDAMSMSSSQRKGLPPLVWAAAALAILAVLVFSWPWISKIIPSMASLTDGISLPSLAASKPSTTTESAPVAANSLTTLPTTASVPTAAPSVGSSVSSSVVSSVSSAPIASLAASSPASSSEAAVDPAQALIIEAAETTWVEIKSPGGVILVSRNVIAGERLLQDLEGKRVVTIGNVSGARVLVRGQPFDLLAVKKDNVARFAVQ